MGSSLFSILVLLFCLAAHGQSPVIGPLNSPMGSPLNSGGSPVIGLSTTSAYYLNTSFNEGTVGATIAGTRPSVIYGGDVWHFGEADAGYTFQSGGGTISSTPTTSPTGGPYIDIGHSDFSATINLYSAGTYTMFMLRYVDQNDMIFCNFDYTNGHSIQLYTYAGGTATLIGSATVNWFNTNVTFNMKGSNITVSSGGTTLFTASSSLSQTGTKVGFSYESGNTASIVNSVSVTPAI